MSVGDGNPSISPRWKRTSLESGSAPSSFATSAGTCAQPSGPTTKASQTRASASSAICPSSTPYPANMKQPDLFEGEARKREGCERVLSHNEEWKARFDADASFLLSLNMELTSEDIVARIGMPPGSPNAVGAAMRAFAARHHLQVLHYRKSTRPTCHAAILAVWGRKETETA